MERKHTVVKYVRNKKGNLVGVLVAVKSEDGFRVGYSLCRIALDRFKKETGLKIAFGRADVWALIPQEIPKDIARFLPSFLERCKKYYKTTNVPAFENSVPF
jgi:hypothetical protein